MYLYKSYYILNDSSVMEKIKDEAAANFEHMRYRQTDLIISMFKILLAEYTGTDQIQPDIEKFELEYLRNGADCDSIIIDSLAFLKIKGLSDTLNVEDLEKRLERLKYTGFIPQIQLTLIQLAGLNYLENRQKEAVNCLKEAVKIYEVILMETLQSHYYQWGSVLFFTIIYEVALLFIPFYKKMDRKPATAYMEFVLAFAIEMHGIPMSMYLISWVKCHMNMASLKGP